jgi:hypothetical protein
MKPNSYPGERRKPFDKHCPQDAFTNPKEMFEGSSQGGHVRTEGTEAQISAVSNTLAAQEPTPQKMPKEERDDAVEQLLAVYSSEERDTLQKRCSRKPPKFTKGAEGSVKDVWRPDYQRNPHRRGVCNRRCRLGFALLGTIGGHCALWRKHRQHQKRCSVRRWLGFTTSPWSF